MLGNVWKRVASVSGRIRSGSVCSSEREALSLSGSLKHMWPWWRKKAAEDLNRGGRGSPVHMQLSVTSAARSVNDLVTVVAIFVT